MAKSKQKQIRSQKASYQDDSITDTSPPEVIHTSPRKQIIAQAHKTSRGSTHIQIFSYQQAAGMRMIQSPEKSLLLTESDSRNLLMFLQSQLKSDPISGKNQLTITHLDNSNKEIDNKEAAKIGNAILSAIRSPAVMKYLIGRNIGTTLEYGMLTLIRVSELRMALTQLRAHLENPDLTEKVYQDWCERNTWAFGNYYVSRDEVRQISATDEVDHIVSDLFGYRDIIELKLPNKEVLVRQSNRKHYYFSAHVSDAMGQCHRYLEVFSKEASKGLHDHPDIVACMPRATVVIGRSNTFTEQESAALRGLNGRLHNITVMTYDHLLQQGEQMLSILSKSVSDPECSTAEHLFPPML